MCNGERYDYEGTICTGSAETPTAPPGKVCIYPTFAFHILTAIGLPNYGQANSSYGFQIRWSARREGVGASQETMFFGVWAYTAP